MNKVINRTILALERQRAISRKARARFFPDPRENIHRHSQFFREIQNIPKIASKQSLREIG